ncbi:tyrosinase family protein [Kitasatospora sp. NPDC101235]|uniref:tyrosinase family protein n=1 Tax=Kitasatospora sp. NPDC101235 TaxID=3364101 RepID=UPI00381919F5
MIERQLAALAQPDLFTPSVIPHDGMGPRTFADLVAMRRTQPEEKVRKSEKDLTTTERSRLINAFNAINQSGVLGNFVAVHAEMHDQHRMTNAPDDMGAQRFLPWHRVLLDQVETELRRVHSDVTIPYWDWTADQQVPQWLTNVLPAVIVPGITPRVIRVTRSPGSKEDLQQRIAGLGNVMRAGTFNTFVDGLENIHDLVHDWVGATMSVLSTAPADPLFFMHHANVDRLWWTWHPSHQNENPTLMGDDMVMEPWRVTEPTTRNIANFHYEYR